MPEDKRKLFAFGATGFRYNADRSVAYCTTAGWVRAYDERDAKMLARTTAMGQHFYLDFTTWTFEVCEIAYSISITVPLKDF